MLSIASSIRLVTAAKGLAARSISTSSLRTLQFTNHENDPNKRLRETMPNEIGEESVDVDLTEGTPAGFRSASNDHATEAAAPEEKAFVSHATDPKKSVFPEVLQKALPQRIERWIPDALHPTEGGGMKFRR